MVLPLRIAGTSSPSANSRIIVPETGEVLSSSKANFLEAFFLGVGEGLAFLEGLGLFLGKLGLLFGGRIGGEPNPIVLRVISGSVGLVIGLRGPAKAAARAIMWC